MNNAIRPKDKIQSVLNLMIDIIQMKHAGTKTSVFLIFIYGMILANILSTIYLLNYIMKNTN